MKHLLPILLAVVLQMQGAKYRAGDAVVSRKHGLSRVLYRLFDNWNDGWVYALESASGEFYWTAEENLGYVY